MCKEKKTEVLSGVSKTLKITRFWVNHGIQNCVLSISTKQLLASNTIVFLENCKNTTLPNRA
jgi:hypothetical protein